LEYGTQGAAAVLRSKILTVPERITLLPAQEFRF
jgi:hypothetical protein